jgi:acetyl-CoA acyltransferase
MVGRDVVIVGAVRSAVGKKNGKLSDWHAVDLLGDVLDGLLTRASVDPAIVDDVICGCVSQHGEQAYNVGRMAWLSAGLPDSVPATTLDRQCGSSQQAVSFAAQGIAAGAYDVVVACGVEHMTHVPLGSTLLAYGSPISERLDRVFGQPLHQGTSAELIAERWQLKREDLDALAARSHRRALAATRAGAFDDEILPLDVETEAGTESFTTDEGIREPDLARIAALPSVFQENGVVTAANSSQLSDGAAAMLLMSREKADELGLRARARIVSAVVVGDDPVLMLTAPIAATRKVLAAADMSMEEVDLVEISEAFASVVLAWKKELGLSDEWFDDHVNIHGGAIALGHPVGASGARLMTTLLNALEQTDGRYGLQTMCEGYGLANATIIERLPA